MSEPIGISCGLCALCNFSELIRYKNIKTKKMGLIKYLKEKYTRRATIADIGKKVAVLWNPQGVRDFSEKPSWREGTIDQVCEDGSFWINFGGATMICPAMIYGRRKNPFRNLKEL